MAKFIYSFRRAGMVDIDPGEFKKVMGKELFDSTSAEKITFLCEIAADPEELWYDVFDTSENIELWEE